MSNGKRSIRKYDDGEAMGRVVCLGGQEIPVRQHPTDFTAIGLSRSASRKLAAEGVELLPGSSRLRAGSREQLDREMDRVRESAIAHHVYLCSVEKDGREDLEREMVITDRLVVELDEDDEGLLAEILSRYGLEHRRSSGGAHILRVLDETGENPLKTANRIRKEMGVAVARPVLRMPIEEDAVKRSPTAGLYRKQWYLNAAQQSYPARNVAPRADIRAPEAWTVTKGSEDVVIAVIDDGFDLDHPVFRGANLSRHERDFTGLDEDASAEKDNYHGTPVASIIFAQHTGGAMRGVAPNCTFLPLRVSFRSDEERRVDSDLLLEVFEYASQHADIVNCSFAFPPAKPMDPFAPDPLLRHGLRELTKSGGRRNTGLIVVCSAGNQDAPTSLERGENKHGVSFLWGKPPRSLRILPGTQVRTGLTTIGGVIVVGAASARLRKAVSSNWGDDLTVVAPSSNDYQLAMLPEGVSYPFPEPRLLAAFSQRAKGAEGGDHEFELPDDPTTMLDESLFTDRFGGTSGAAPQVSGVVGLMLSVNPRLTPPEVQRILRATARRDLDPTRDIPNAVNLEGFPKDYGAFTSDGRSPFFGSGLVDAFAAVSLARALAEE